MISQCISEKTTRRKRRKKVAAIVYYLLWQVFLYSLYNFFTYLFAHIILFSYLCPRKNIASIILLSLRIKIARSVLRSEVSPSQLGKVKDT